METRNKERDVIILLWSHFPWTFSLSFHYANHVSHPVSKLFFFLSQEFSNTSSLSFSLSKGFRKVNEWSSRNNFWDHLILHPPSPSKKTDPDNMKGLPYVNAEVDSSTLHVHYVQCRGEQWKEEYFLALKWFPVISNLLELSMVLTACWGMRATGLPSLVSADTHLLTNRVTKEVQAQNVRFSELGARKKLVETAQALGDSAAQWFALCLCSPGRAWYSNSTPFLYETERHLQTASGLSCHSGSSAFPLGLCLEFQGLNTVYYIFWWKQKVLFQTTCQLNYNLNFLITLGLGKTVEQK